MRVESSDLGCFALVFGLTAVILVILLTKLKVIKWVPTGSRYVSWLPSFSVEVSRVRLEPPRASQLEAMARQVQAMFPAYPLAALVADLVVTRAPELTIDNILEGRLPPPPAPLAVEVRGADAAAASATHAHTHDASTQGPAAAATAEATTATEPELEVSHPFPRSSLVRESLLRRRKEALVASARRRYLQRVSAKGPAPAPAPAAPPS